MQGAFVTGTDTGVGKTVVACCITAALRARGLRVAAIKPVVTGLDEPEPGRAPDHELLAEASGTTPDRVTTETFGPAVSPHLAAELAGRTLDPSGLVARAKASATGADVVIAEGVGGLLVPLTPPYLMRDLAYDLGLPLVIVARPGLGTINHTLLTLGAARADGLRVLGVVLTPWAAEPNAMERSNLATIERLGDVPVDVLPHLGRDASELATAGQKLRVTELAAPTPEARRAGARAATA
jgi:dethiobiotin synthetase